MPLANTSTSTTPRTRTRRTTQPETAPPVVVATPPAPPRRLTSRDTEIHSYHSNARNRVVQGDPRELFGLEMEVVAGTGEQRTAAVRAANQGENEHFVDAEQDGSLDYSRGVEFITRTPMTAAALFETNGWLDRFTSRIIDSGVRSGMQPSGYGIHINVNCHGWSEFAKQAFCAAVNLGDGYHRQIARRDHGGGTYGANYFYVSAPTRAGSTRQQIFSGWRARGQNAYVRSNNTDCIEVRSFQSTTSPEVIRNYVQHLRDLREFSKRYQSLLLYTAVAVRSGWFTTSEGFNYVAMLFRDRPSYSVAIAQLPDTRSSTYLSNNVSNATPTGTRRSHNQLYLTGDMGVILNAVFDQSTSFRLRKEAMRNAWVSAQSSAEQGDDEDYDDDEDDY